MWMHFRLFLTDTKKYSKWKWSRLERLLHYSVSFIRIDRLSCWPFAIGRPKRKCFSHWKKWREKETYLFIRRIRQSTFSSVVWKCFQQQLRCFPFFICDFYSFGFFIFPSCTQQRERYTHIYPYMFVFISFGEKVN